MANDKDFRGWFFKLLYKLRVRSNIFFFNALRIAWCWLKGVETGKKVKLAGMPSIHREPNSRIKLGDNCVLNSSKHSVHVGLFKPNVFFTMQKDAEIIFGDNSGATGSTFVAAKSIRIGNNVMIGANCTIIDNDFHNVNPSQRELNKKESIPANSVVIEDDVFLGFNVMVLKGVTIGRNSVIGANSVVLQSIPPDSVAMGNPCKVFFKRNWKK